jgi:rRNA-processing protein FCF1
LGGGAEACLLALIGDTNPEHYVIATQDAGLKEKLKHIPGVSGISTTPFPHSSCFLFGG